MNRMVEIPLWLFLLILLFAGVTFLSHFLVPPVRWFVRRRMERAVARLNQRLKRPITPFKLLARTDMIQRLIYDPEVIRAVAEEAHAKGVPEAVAFARARAYAREIVPAFSATLYFGMGVRLARWLSRALYDVRMSEEDRARLDRLDPEAAVVFVINHRSNMDYVLVTWLVSETSTLSYAVGEWARVWPLSAVVRSMGGYFIRRRDRGPLYRRVLARYVQMAVAGGVTQAIFPEGRLSLDGRTGEPRLGLLSYIVEGHPTSGRDVLFVPVALNYDRVIEDRFLLKAHLTGVRRFRPSVGEVLSAVGGHLWARATGRFRGFGAARVSLGRPLSLGDFLATGPNDPTPALAAELMARVRAAIPALPVPLVARHLDSGAGPRAPAAIAAGVARDLTVLAERGIAAPPPPAAAVAAEGLRLLIERGVVLRASEEIAVRPGEEPLLDVYAASIEHHFTDTGR